MKVAFGPEIFLHQKYGGITRYFAKLAEGLPTYGVRTSICSPLYLSPLISNLSRARTLGRHISSLPNRGSGAVRFVNNLAGRTLAQSLRPDIFHSTYFSFLDYLPWHGQKVVTVYDMNYELAGVIDAPENHPVRRKKLASVSKADLILTISNKTKEDLLEIFPWLDEWRVRVTHLGVDDPDSTFFNLKDRNEDPFLLYVGPREGYKNAKALTLALARLSEEVRGSLRLVFFGGPTLSESEYTDLALAGVPRCNVSQKFGDDSALEMHYRTALALVYTSRYEGFGLPIIEAMSHGCPVICGDDSVFPEVAGEAAILVDTSSPTQIATAIMHLLGSSAETARLSQLGKERAAAFSWANCVEETLNAYRYLSNVR